MTLLLDPGASAPLDLRQRRQQRRLRMRREILVAAQKLFDTEPNSVPSMEHIARAAQVSVGTLYNYFSDREHLLADLVQQEHDVLMAQLAELHAPNAQAPKTFEARLKAHLKPIMSHFRRNWQLYATLLDLPPTSQAAGLTCRVFRPMFERLTEETERLLQEGLSAGTLNPQHARRAAPALIGSLRGVLFHNLLGLDAEPALTDLDGLVDLFLNGASHTAKSESCQA